MGSSSSAPVRTDSIEAEETEFRIETNSDFRKCSPMSAYVKGTLFRNAKVPFKYTSIIAFTKREGQHPLLHAGLSLAGDFTVRHYKYTHMLVERWDDAVTVRLYRSRTEMFQRFTQIRVFGHQLEDSTETPEFSSEEPADVMVDFVHTDLNRRFDVPSGTHSEAAFRRYFADQSSTSCVLFAIRGGQKLQKPEKQSNFFKAYKSTLEGCLD